MSEESVAVPGEDPPYVPDFDISKPTIARVYDAVLGGKDNFAVDREGAAIMMKHLPGSREAGLDNRAGLEKGAAYMAKLGIDQFLDIGAGLPTVRNTHEVVQEINPDAKVMYVDNDPIVLAHGRALLATNQSTAIATADLRDPPSILNHPDVQKLLDFDRPIGLMIIGLIMHFHPDENPGNWIRELVDALPSGSYLLITDFVNTGRPEQEEFQKACIQALGNGWSRTPEEITANFQGLPLQPPGLDFISRWFPDDPDREVPAVEDLDDFQRIMMVGLGYKDFDGEVSDE